MAGEWLKFEANTPEKPEVFAITVEMGWDDPDLAVGKLLKVWRWFDQQTIDGNAPNVTLSLLDRISGVSGFAQAMCNVGWLVGTDTGLHLPNFDRHNGKTAKDRCLTAKRVAKHKTNATGNAPIVTFALPKEEKRREELKNKDNDDTATPDFDPPTAVPLPPSEPIPEPQDPAVVLAVAMRKMGVQANSAHPAVQGWAAAGVTVEMIGEAVGTARISKPTGNIPANYLAPIVDDLLHPPAARGTAQPRAAPVNEKFNFGHLDHSSNARAMADSMARHGITLPPPDEEIEL